MGRKLKLGVLVAFFVFMLSACTYAGTYRLTVNKGTNCVTVYEKQGNDYVPIKAMICSVGQMMVRHLGYLTLVLSILGDHFSEMYMVSMPQE